MSLPSLGNQPVFLLAAAVLLFGIGQYWWRYNQAKGIAQDWLHEHHYRVLKLSQPWFHGAVFPPTPLRDSDRAFVFEAIIDDEDLGGSGAVLLRVWTTWLGVTDSEVDVAWKRMPHGGGAGEYRPLAERLADEQLGLMRRVEAGETRFYAPRRYEKDGAKYDEMVEHLLALSRRGMITCTEPEAGIKGVTQYSDVADVALTPAGREFLESRPKPAGRS
jgi:hypothetical protein